MIICSYPVLSNKMCEFVEINAKILIPTSMSMVYGIIIEKLIT